jgi:hypothetical protein
LCGSAVDAFGGVRLPEVKTAQQSLTGLPFIFRMALSFPQGADSGNVASSTSSPRFHESQQRQQLFCRDLRNKPADAILHKGRNLLMVAFIAGRSGRRELNHLARHLSTPPFRAQASVREIVPQQRGHRRRIYQPSNRSDALSNAALSCGLWRPVSMDRNSLSGCGGIHGRTGISAPKTRPH